MNFDVLSPYIPFTGRDFRKKSDRESSVAERAEQKISAPLGKFLEEWNAQLPPNVRRDENLHKLISGKALTVITGQQIGLFGGPLFTLYKILTAISFAKQLERETQKEIVPVFWLQSEDHDFLEVNSLPIIDSVGKISSLSIPPFERERVSLGDMRTPDSIGEHLGRFAELSVGLPDAPQINEALQKSYVGGTPYALSFARFLSLVLKDYGIIFFDPRAAVVRGIGREVFLNAFSKRAEISAALKSQEDKLVASGLEAQVFVREHSPLFFLHDQSKERFRLSEEGDRFEAISGGHGLSVKDLMSKLQTSPGDFSTSALLRPVLQDSLFPNAAYIGGEAEVRYFAQNSVLYSLFGLPLPLMVPRSGFLIVDEKTQRLQETLGLSLKDLYQPQAKIEQTIAAKLVRTEDSAESLRAVADQHLKQIREEFERAILKTDQTLGQPLEKSFSRAKESFDGLLDRYQKALVRNSETTLERLSRVQRFLVPEGLPQERFHGVAPFLARYGESLPKLLLERIDPLVPQDHEIHL